MRHERKEPVGNMGSFFRGKMFSYIVLPFGKIAIYIQNIRKDEVNMDFQVIDNCLMIRLPEEIDHHEAGFICENADRYLLREEVQNVVFDFERTRFMDSSGIGIIMGRYRKISCFGGRVYAIHMDRQIERIFKLSGLNKVVEVLDAQETNTGYQS